jgi:hypothetical protein
VRAAAANILVWLVSIAGCDAGEITSGMPRAGSPDGGGGGGDELDGASADPVDGSVGGGMWEAELAFCVDETNRYREMHDLPALARDGALEDYAAVGAEIDHESGEPHKHFLDTNGGGLASAENEIPRWPVSQFGSVENVIREGIEMMYDEGPGGAHHDAIVGDYQRLGCGIWLAGDLVTVVQDFGG